MAFGPEHINVSPVMGLDRPGPLVPDSLAAAINNTNALIRLSGALASGPGGCLYFPPGRYYLGRSSGGRAPLSLTGGELGDIVVPTNVTLWFAPGAVLVPMAGDIVGPDTRFRRQDGQEHLRLSVCIEIHGDIIAERRQIFSLWIDEGAMTQRAGVVFLLGDRIREVYPEWWGATPEHAYADPTPRKNADAIQAAIDAAYHNRVSPRREADGTASRVPETGEVRFNNRPSIPVVMMGRYYIDREIQIGVSSTWSPSETEAWKQPPLSGFELEGERAMGSLGAGHPSLQAAPGFSGRALLAIRGPTTFSIRNMTFDGHYEVLSCVTVETIDPVLGSAIFDGCSFFKASMQQSAPGASTALVVLDAETRRRRARPGVSPVGTLRDYWNVSFRRCLFQPGDINSRSATRGTEYLSNRIHERVVPDVGNNVVGVEVRLGDNEGLEFRECVFRDAASPGIRAFSGRFAMRNCLMHLSRPPRLDERDAPENYTTSPPIDGRTYPVHRDWPADDHPHGADIIIEEPHALGPSSVVVPLMPASFTINTMQSHSWQVFAARRIPPDALDACVPSPVVVMDMKSVLENTVSSARELDPPSVFWPAGGPGSIGSPLTLIGCEFRGRFQRIPGRQIRDASGAVTGYTLTPGEQRDYPRVVVIGNGLRGPVYNLGTQLVSTNGELGIEGLTQAVHGADDAIDPPVLQLRTRVVG